MTPDAAASAVDASTAQHGLTPQLDAWLDAARVGGLPAATRSDRWQPLRAGVVGLWEFDAAEYWYADGWAQLTGSNETGKSSLMALTTLIPWLADTSTSSIDTLGRSGKEFRYYVEPSGKEGDRRSTEATTHRGWLWVEYGRLRDGDPEFLTTLLFAESRSAGARVTRLWCTARNLRVRRELDLAPGRVVAHPKDLARAGFVQHPSGTAYKEHLAEHLLGGTVGRLEAAGKMLRVTRTPKLGAQLQIGFVTEQLRTALPELDRAEVDALAAGWDQLDQLRADMEATERAVSTMEGFRKNSWLPWVRAALRLRADRAARARSTFDRVTRDERGAGQDVADLTTRETDLESAVRTAGRDVEEAAAAREALQESDRYRDAQGRIDLLARHRAEANRLQDQLGRDEAEVVRADNRLNTTRTDVEQRVLDANEARRASEETRDRLAAAASDAQVPVPSGDIDLALLEQRLVERDRAIGRARELLREAERAEAAASRAEESAADARDRAQRDRASATATWQQAEEARTAVVAALALWADEVHPAVTDDVVDAWVGAIAAEVVDGRVPGLPVRDLVRADWYDPARLVLDRDLHEAQRRKRTAQEQAVDLGRRIEALKSAPTPTFATPPGWQRRTRPAPSENGAPLWALVDPQPDLPMAELAHIEAALAAQGVLDAWVTPDGYHGTRDGIDAVLAPDSDDVDNPQPSLARVLRPAHGSGALARPVTTLLDRIRLVDNDQQLPTSGLAVTRQGRWRAGDLAGAAEPSHPNAEWLGESARAEQRRRLVAELEQERDQALAEVEAATAEEERVRAASVALTEQFEHCPSDDHVRTVLTLAGERETAADKSEQEADQAERRAADERATAHRAVAALREHCADAALPHDASGLDTAKDEVNDVRRRADRLRTARQRLADGLSTLEAAQARFEQDEALALRAREAFDRTTGDLGEARATVEALESTMGADDQVIVAELSELKQREEDAKTRRSKAEDDLREVIGRLAKARTTLETVQRRREEATVARDDAFADFRVLVDRGLASEAALDLPDAEAVSIEKVREQVVAVRREVQITGWPDDEAAQGTVERRLSSELTQAVHNVRADLEARGRSMQVVVDDVGLPRVEVLVDAGGTPHGPLEASALLTRIHEELSTTYTDRVQETLNELLGSTFLEHLRGRVGAADALVGRINDVLEKHPVVTTSTSLRIRLEPANESDGRMLAALRGSSLANPEAAAHIREHLRNRVEAAKRDAQSQGEADWRDRLTRTLDYRGWFEVALQRKIGAGGRWQPLTTQSFAEMSGGARAVMLMLPLVATLAALYEDMDGGPRPLWLDEAFDGLDSANRATVMDLFRSFDFDVLLAGPARLVNVRTVPAAAIWQVVRAPAPLPGAELMLELWAGDGLRVVDVPNVLPTRLDQEPPNDTQDALL
ncbi:MAG: TIGR02680 family protein [Propionibacterium sp.]|nr:TIGR02680 family protein [Propionibacterium sp.]